MKDHYMLLGVQLSVYWTVFAIGVITMLIMNCIRARKSDIKILNSFFLTLGVIVISFLGAKILYYIEQPSVLLTIGIRFGGVSFFGSVFLVPLVMILISKIFKLDYYAVMDFLSPSLMLMLAVLRIGCYLSDCCGGILLNVSGDTVRFPSQITECIIDILIMVGLLIYEKYWSNKGRLYFFIMIYYGVFRFMLEFLRDTPKDWFGFSHGQWFAIISVCIGGYMLYYLGKRDRQAVKRKRSLKK